MKILAIDSSGLVASAAIWEGASASVTGTILATASTDYKKTHSQTLLPMIDRICKETDSEPKSFDAVAVAAGPGSFTGNLWGAGRAVCPMMDARRNQVYSGLYGFEDDELITYRDQEALALEDMLSFINDLGRDVIFLGDGADAYHERICEGTKVKYSFAPAHLNRQNAASLAAMGARMYGAGRYVNADDHSPVYLRVSQAEREGTKNFDLVG